MSSQKQIEANRANAKKSTGPKTADGKSRSRGNALKHGLTASLLIIAGEEAEDFDDFRAALMDHHDPQSPLEREFVERLAGILWRLRRVPAYDAGIIYARQAQLEKLAFDSNYGTPFRVPGEFEVKGEEMPDAEWSNYVGHSFIQDAGYSDALGKLNRYEAGLMRALEKTLQLLDEQRCAGSAPAKLEVVARSAAA
jgi:hypothetical protein